jgi:Helix-turn-helix domain
MKMNQKDHLLQRLNIGEWFSTVECVRDFHILRLGARIWDLRSEGYEIEERRVEGKNWSEYRLRPARPIVLPPAFKPKPEVKWFRSPVRAGSAGQAARGFLCE